MYLWPLNAETLKEMKVTFETIFLQIGTNVMTRE